MKRIVIPEYIKYVKISNKKQIKYYHTLRSIKSNPVKEALNKGEYKWKYWNGKPTLFDNENRPVIANPNSHGKPNFVKINGQDSTFTKHLLGKVKLEMRSFFEPFFDNLIIEKEDLPLKIRYEISDIIFDLVAWDLDNRASIYRKVLQDIIRDRMPKYMDDNNLFMPSYTIDYVPIENKDDRMIVVEIRKDTRKKLDKEFYIKAREKWMKKRESNT